VALTDDHATGTDATDVTGTDVTGTDVTGTARLHFTVLRGGVAVQRDGDDLALGGPQQRRLLAALLAAEGSPVSADRLTDTIWPDGAMPDGARRTVMSYVSRLRSTIGGEYVVTGANGYQLVLGDAGYDAAEFEARLGVARDASGAAAVAAYDHALQLWSGRAFGDDRSEWWLAPVATRLEELRLVAHQERCERLIEIGRHADAVADLQGLIADQPLREQFVALEMRALYLGGRQAEALRTYRSFADYLAEETGLDPSDMLVDLERRILVGDPSLAPASTVAVPGYELGECIGEGAFGAVYRAVQPSLGREVAIKAIRAELADDPRFVQRFESEAQLVARLEHPHVVPLYDFWRQPGAAYLVFRLLRGGSLAERIASGPLPVDEVSRIVAEIGGALAAAHAIGIVHRDVKPANVLFDESGNSYLADFGIADAGNDRLDTALRSAGSPLYASPEQARDGTAGPWADQYALAVVAWEALTGRVPFAGTTATEVLTAKLAQPLPSLSDVPGVAGADALDAVLRRASAPVPVDRFRDVAEFVNAWVTACSTSDTVRTTGRLTGDPSAARAAGTLASVSLGSVNPYKGLRAFREADAAEYRGRTQLVDALVARVDTDPFVLVVGPSGSGKSSLVHAGAVPALRGRDALVVSMVPGDDPFVELHAALRRVATADMGDVGTRLRAPGGLAAIARDITGESSTGTTQLVLVIDQFEELWTLVTSDAVRDRFATCIADALTSQHDIRIVATLRADLYDRPLQHAVLGPIVRDATFAVTPMTSAELHDAVVLPAERAGVRFEPGLVAAMVGDVVSRPGALPLLQFALTELFEQRVNGVVTAAAYTELGGIGGAIARRAEQLYEETPAGDRRDVRLLFTQLVSPGDDSDDLRRRAARDELDGVDPTVIDRFLSHRLLVSDVHPVTREPTLEVAHEALLREWPRLREWIDEDRDIIRVRRSLGAAAHEWLAQARDEALLFRGSRLVAAREVAQQGRLSPAEREFLQASGALDDRERTETAARVEHQARQNRRLRGLLVAVGAVLVVALIAGVVALGQRNRADDEAATARDAQAEAEAATVEAEAQRTQAETARVDAVTAQNAALARGLAAQSGRLLAAKQKDLAQLLAVEAARFADEAGGAGTADDEAYAALMQGVSDDPLRVAQLDVPDGVVLEAYPREAGGVEQMMYSPDGRTLAALTYRGDVRLWDADTGELHEAQPGSTGVAPPHAPFAMSDTLLAYVTYASGSGPTALWDIAAQAPLAWQPPGPLDSLFPGAPMPGAGGFFSLALSENGLLARSFSSFSLGQTTSLEVWDTNTGTVVSGPISVEGIVKSLAFSPDGTLLAVNAISTDELRIEMEMFDVATGASRWRTVAHPGSTTESFDDVLQYFSAWVRFSANGTEVSSIVSRSTVGAIATLDTATGTQWSTNGVGQGRTVMEVSHDMRHLILAAGIDDPGGPWGTITPTEVVDAATGDVLASFETDAPPLGQQPRPIRPNSTEFAIQRTPGRILIRDWKSVGVEPFATVTPAQRFGGAIASHPDGEVVDVTEPLARLGIEPGGFNAEWAASDSGQAAIVTASTVEIWDPTTRTFLRSLDKPTDCVTQFVGKSVAFAGTADDGSVAVRCNGSLLAWDLASPERTPAWRVSVGAQFYPSPLLLSPDGSRIVVFGGGEMRSIDVATGDDLATAPSTPIGLAYSPDGSMVLAIDWPGTVRVLDADDLSLIKTLTPRGGAANDGGLGGAPLMAVSPDNAYVAVAHEWTGVELWNLSSGESVAFIGGRPDAQPPAAGDEEASIDLGQLGRATSPTMWLRFVDGGAGLEFTVARTYSNTDDEWFHYQRGTRWSLTPDTLVDTACRLADRQLTEAEWAKYIGGSIPYEPSCGRAAA
jgi:serine/threonine protein kinase/WD40 repeat protein